MRDEGKGGRQVGFGNSGPVPGFLLPSVEEMVRLIEGNLPGVRDQQHRQPDGWWKLVTFPERHDETYRTIS